MSAGAPIPPNPAYRNVPPPPPATSGNTVLKIVLIVVGVFVVFGIIVAGVIGIGVYRVAKGAHKDSNGNVSISTPNGTITTGTSAISEADLGTAVYPGAVSGQGSMNMKTPNGSMVTAVYTSTDAADKIIAFYKEKLGDQASVVQSSNGTVLSSGDKEKDSIVITITPEGNSSKIAIIHVTNAKSQ
jgi:energy-converting hydrogenase Eha subunit A